MKIVRVSELPCSQNSEKTQLTKKKLEEYFSMLAKNE